LNLGGEVAHNLLCKQKAQDKRIEGSLKGNGLREGREISPHPPVYANLIFCSLTFAKSEIISRCTCPFEANTSFE